MSPDPREVPGKIDPQQRCVNLPGVVGQQRHAFQRGVPAALAMGPEVLVDKRAVGSIAKLLRTPELAALLAVRPQPRGSGLVVASERVSQVLHLEKLSDERSGRVPVASSQELDGPASKLTADLGERCDAHDTVVAEAVTRLAGDSMRPKHPSVNPEHLANTSEARRDRIAHHHAMLGRGFVSAELL